MQCINKDNDAILDLQNKWNDGSSLFEGESALIFNVDGSKLKKRTLPDAGEIPHPVEEYQKLSHMLTKGHYESIADAKLLLPLQ
eukprot:6476508-Ditylum_brightwellii.AAC.1